MSKLNELNVKYSQIRKNFMDILQDEFKISLSEFFDNYPEVKGFFWTQYTPYFADGDPCEFRVGEICYMAASEPDLDDASWEDTDYHYEGSSVFSKPSEYAYNSVKNDGVGSYYYDRVKEYETKVAELGPRFVEVSSALNQFLSDLSGLPDELFLDMFGDHVKVIVTRNEIRVDEYDHD